jgi:hypothetical protein
MGSGRSDVNRPSVGSKRASPAGWEVSFCARPLVEPLCGCLTGSAKMRGYEE